MNKYAYWALICCLSFSNCEKTSDRKSKPIDSVSCGDKKITYVKFVFGGDLGKSNEATYSPIADIRAIAVQRNDDYAIILDNNHAISKINSNGDLIFQYKLFGQGPAELRDPTDIKIRNNNIFVLDQGNNKIAVFSLNGKWEMDINIHDTALITFDVDEKKNIFSPKISGGYSNDCLFVQFDSLGNKINEFGSYQDITEQLTQPIFPALFYTPNKTILLVVRADGYIYQFNQSGALLNKFDIRNGPEWEKWLEVDANFKKRFGKGGGAQLLKIDALDFDSNSNIYIQARHDCEKKETVAFIFDKSGCFSGRIFGSDLFRYKHSLIGIQNDSTIWIYSQPSSVLAQCRFR